MQTAVLNPSYSYCRAQQTLEPSCSLSSPSTTPFFHPSSPFKNSIFGARIFPSGRSNLVRRSFARSVPTGIHSYAGTWSDKYKDRDERRFGSTTNQLPSTRDFLGDFLVWRPPVGLENNQAFWVALTLWMGVVAAALFLQR